MTMQMPMLMPMPMPMPAIANTNANANVNANANTTAPKPSHLGTRGRIDEAVGQEQQGHSGVEGVGRGRFARTSNTDRIVFVHSVGICAFVHLSFCAFEHLCI